MTYIKKMCILRQARQGFSGDGKTLSGLIKVEQYGKNLAVEVSVINFAPLASGEYYCLLSDSKGRVETLALRGKSLFNILSDIDISGGFCGVICYVKNEIVPIAYGINGNGAYDWKRILGATLPPTFDKKSEESAAAESVEERHAEEEKSGYDDETVATENYYREAEDGQIVSEEAGGDALAQSPAQEQSEEARTNAKEDVDDEGVRHPFATDGDGYYRSVKSEIDELFAAHPKDDTLKGAFSCSEWVRVKGEEGAPEYLVGVVYDDGRAKYICYALKAADKDSPPEEIKDACSFVPCSLFDDGAGFFVIFQSATTGECIKPEKV
ncbi:MAG: hypothetical protein IJ514_06680 [Clostridia bacterium]|nr:hypothetical protein [Clostridia bacterium]